MISYTIGVARYNVERIKFPGGEVNVRLTSLPNRHQTGTIKIRAHLKSSDDVMALLLTNDALKRAYPAADIVAQIPYIPYGRQDRLMVEGESLSIAVMAQLINSCGFKMVETLDPHSGVTEALINNLYVKDQVAVFRNVFRDWSGFHIVAPDAGAEKKAYTFAKAVGAAGVLTCSKQRNPQTGQIIGIRCHASALYDKLFVLDDICDGGRTFTALSEELQDHTMELYLGVTHGIFSKGVNEVAAYYDHIFTTNSYHGSAGIVENDYEITWLEAF